MDGFITAEIRFEIANRFERVIRGEHLNTGRDLLRLKPGVHFINDRIRNALDRRTLCVAPLTLINRERCHIDDIDPIPILFCHGFVAVHFRSFGICGIDDGKTASLHTQLQHLEKHIPDNLIVLLTDGNIAGGGEDRGGTLHTDCVSA